MNRRFICERELALEVVERQLHRHVLLARQVVERVGEVVEDRDRLHDDHRHRHRLQQRQDHAAEDLPGLRAVDPRRLVEIARDRRDEAR